MTTKGLGKGLGALISMFDEDMEELARETKANEIPKTAQTAQPQIDMRHLQRVTVPKEETKNTDGIKEIDINLIDRNISQPRRLFNPEEMQELEQSIAEHGILQPILLNKIGSRFMIVAGERRWRAAKTVGLKTIPALVREYTPKQIAEISLVENLMRSDLNEIEVAHGIRKLMETYRMTQEQLSNVLGKSRSAIANSLRILNLPQEVQSMLEQKQISMGHAKCLSAISDKNQCISLAKRCADGLMTVRELEAATTTKRFSHTNLPAPKIQTLELRELTIKLTQLFSTKVTIQGNENKGKIIIEYQSPNDLERIKSKIK